MRLEEGGDAGRRWAVMDAAGYVRLRCNAHLLANRSPMPKCRIQCSSAHPHTVTHTHRITTSGVSK